MDPQMISDIDTALQLVNGHKWMALAILVVGAAIRLMKDDRAVAWFRIEIAPRFRSWAALALGVILGVLHKLAYGGTWGEAIVGGVIAGGGSTWLHELVIESIRRGRDIGMKKDEAPPPSNPKPPISIKPPAMRPPPSIRPPADVVIRDADLKTDPPRGGPLFVAHNAYFKATWIGFLLFLFACSASQAKVVVQQGELVEQTAACRRKSLAVIAEKGTCEEKRARLDILMQNDADCVGLYADAGQTFTCRDGGAHLETKEGGTE